MASATAAIGTPRFISSRGHTLAAIMPISRPETIARSQTGIIGGGLIVSWWITADEIEAWTSPFGRRDFLHGVRRTLWDRRAGATIRLRGGHRDSPGDPSHLGLANRPHGGRTSGRDSGRRRLLRLGAPSARSLLGISGSLALARGQ